MVRVRDVFQIHPEHMREVKSAVLDMRDLGKRMGYPQMRVLTDFIGEYYTLVLESDYPSLNEWEQALTKSFGDKEWQTKYGRIRPMVRGGRREIFQVLE